MDFSVLVPVVQAIAVAVLGALTAVAAIKVVVGFARWAYDQVDYFFAVREGNAQAAYEEMVIYTSSGGVRWTQADIDELKAVYAEYPEDEYSDDDREVLRAYS